MPGKWKGRRKNILKFYVDTSHFWCKYFPPPTLKYLYFTWGSVQEKTLSDGDLTSLKLRECELLGWVSWDLADAVLRKPALTSSSRSSSFSLSPFFVPFLEGLYQSPKCLPEASFSGFPIQFSVDRRPFWSSLLLMLEDSLVKLSWILSEDILKVFTAICRACRDLSQLIDLWTFSRSLRDLRLLPWLEAPWRPCCGRVETSPGPPGPVSSYLAEYVMRKKISLTIKDKSRNTLGVYVYLKLLTLRRCAWWAGWHSWARNCRVSCWFHVRLLASALK